MGFGDSRFSEDMQEFTAVHRPLARRLTGEVQLGPQHLRRTHELHFRGLFVGQTAPGLGQQYSAVRRITLAVKIIDFGPFGVGEMPAYPTLYLAQHFPIAHIAGHEHIAPGRKKDPGHGFDWDLLKKNVAWPSQYFPEV
jgi:hypothetical protein